MTYRRQTRKPVDQAAQEIEAAARAHGFGVLHQYDFRRTLAEKGFPIERECRVLEVCNPRQARDVLEIDMSLNMALPCRISVYEQDGATVVGMIPPTALVGLVSEDPRLAPAAREVERTLAQVIESVL